ncbi:MAG: hypothetical protein ACLTMP_05360, partial [Eggerthella lenta]
MELDGSTLYTARKTPWYKRDPLAKREKEDYRRFMSVVGKHIVFYSERSGFYKYFQGAVEWLLANSDACVHYVTSDPNDQVFKLHEANPRLMPYYIGDKRLITLMMKLDCDVAVMTLDDLENFYIKRSYIRKDIEYVYAFHHMTSTTWCARRRLSTTTTPFCAWARIRRRSSNGPGRCGISLVAISWNAATTCSIGRSRPTSRARPRKLPRAPGRVVPSCSSLRRGRRTAC